MLEQQYDLFKDNKYTRWYYQIVNNARTQNRIKSDGSYYERHHIVPKSLGGNEANINKVLLTFKEHFICHWLLTKMVDKKEHFWKMNSALNRMAHISPSLHTGRILLSWQFVRAKQAHVDARKGKPGPNSGKKFSDEFRAKISSVATGRVLSKETRAKMSASKTGRVLSKETRAKMSASATGRIHSAEARAKMSVSQMKTYSFYDPENNHIIVTNLREFCKDKDLQYCNMNLLYNGNYKPHGNFLTTYKGWRSANPVLTGEAIAA